MVPESSGDRLVSVALVPLAWAQVSEQGESSHPVPGRGSGTQAELRGLVLCLCQLEAPVGVVERAGARTPPTTWRGTTLPPLHPRWLSCRPNPQGHKQSGSVPLGTAAGLGSRARGL